MYPHHNIKGVKECAQKFGYYVSGPGKPKKPVKLKPIAKGDMIHPEHVTFDTFNKMSMKAAKKIVTTVQHWGYEKRFDY